MPRRLLLVLAQTVIYTDAATATLDLQPSGSDTAQYVDSGTDLLDLQPSGSEMQLVGGQTVDSGTESLDLQPSGSEVSVLVDSGTDYLDLQPSGVDAIPKLDSGTCLLDLQPSGYENLPVVYIDADTAELLFSPSACEIMVFLSSEFVVIGQEEWETEEEVHFAFDSIERWNVREATIGEIAECQ